MAKGLIAEAMEGGAGARHVGTNKVGMRINTHKTTRKHISEHVFTPVFT